MNNTPEKGMVDAIEEGRIVRVSESYARMEGLMILRKAEISSNAPVQTKKDMTLTPRLRGERKAYFDIEKYRRPFHDKNDILASLIDNFHWIISSKRKQLNLTRKQVAEAINSSEEDIKMIENGVLPHSDYILISKIENCLKLKLRKDAQNLAGSQTYDIKTTHKPKWADRIGKKGPKADELLGSDIELVDDSESEK